MIVLAVVDEARPLPPGVTVLAHVRATGGDRVRQAVDGGAVVVDHDSMLLTILETADELRLSRRQVERFVKDGKLPAVVLGNVRRIDRDDLEAFIAEHRQTVSR